MRDLARVGARIIGETALTLGGANLGLDRFGGERRGERQLDRADRFVFVTRHETLGGETITRRRGFEQQPRRPVTQRIRRHDIGMSPRKDRTAQEGGHPAVREVADHALEGLLRLIHRVPDRPVCERCIGGLATFVLETLQRRGHQIERRQDVAEPCRELLAPLETTAHHQQRDVGEKRESRRKARQLLVITPHLGRHRRFDAHEVRAGQPQPEGAQTVLQREADMPPEGAVEAFEALSGIGLPGRRHLGEQIGMAADRPLAEDDQRTGEDVRALDGDADRRLLPGAAEEVRRTETDALAADHVHAVADHLARPLGDVILGDRRGDGRLFAEIDRASGEFARRIHQIGVGGDARQRLFDALEAADRHAELLTHARIAAHRACGELRHAGVGRGQ